MTRQPTFDDVFRVISAAAVGETGRRVELPGELDIDDPATKLAVAINFLLEDLEFRNAQVKSQYETLHRTEEQLRQSQKMESIGRLAGGVAHDFNNLLAVILSYGELLMLRIDPSDPMRNEVAEIVKAAGRAAKLTGQLLAFSRQQVVEPYVIDLNDLLWSMEGMLKRLVGEDVELETIPAEELTWVKIDIGQMEQVLMNLVINARDAMPHGGTVTMAARNVVLDEGYAHEHFDAKPGMYVMLSVSDTGTGMDKATMAHLFEPFFTTKERGRGTGLGLSTVYGIVKQNGGSIGVDSQPGRGTTFEILLPYAPDRMELHVPRSVAVWERRGTETILLVEDDDQVRAVALEILRRNGYAVLEAAGPEEALSISSAHPGKIHLLLTDVVMPHMNGRELAKKFDSLRPDTRVLFMSGYTADTIVRHDTAEAGIALVEKPFTPDGLLKKIREVIERRPKSETPGRFPPPS